MATVKRGTHVPSPQWGVHLRPYWRRLYWKRERGAVRKEINRCRGSGLGAGTRRHPMV